MYIKQISNDDYIYIHQKYKDPILSYSGRLAPSRYFNTYLLSYPGALEEVQRDIRAKSPVLILLRLTKEAPMPIWLEGIIHTRYVKLDSMPPFDIFVLQLRAHEIRNRIAHISSAPWFSVLSRGKKLTVLSSGHCGHVSSERLDSLSACVPARINKTSFSVCLCSLKPYSSSNLNK